MRGDECQIFEVFRGECIELQAGVGKVDALAGSKVRSRGPNVCDDQFDFVVCNAFDGAADPAIVEPHLFTYACMVKGFWECASDPMRRPDRRRLGRVE